MASAAVAGHSVYFICAFQLNFNFNRFFSETMRLSTMAIAVSVSDSETYI